MDKLVCSSLYYAVKIGEFEYARFFDDKDAVAYAIVMSGYHPGEWFIEDLGTGKKWLVNRDAINL